MKNWFKRNLWDVLYLWIAVLAGIVYAFTGDTGYLIAALVAPITHHYIEGE